MKQEYRAMLACIGMGLGHAFAAVPDPADASVVIPATDCRSPFADYRPLGEDNNTPWRDANDTVGKIGGWRGAFAEPALFKSEGKQSMPLMEAPRKEVEVTVKKPSGGKHGGH